MKATVRLTKKELFSFLFYHMYVRPTGIIYALVGLASVAGGIYYLVNGNKSGIFLILIAGVYFILQPLMLYIKAAQQAKNVVFANDTYYEFSEEGIAVWQDGLDPSVLQWQNVRKVAKFGKYYFLYVDSAHGNIIPRSAFDCNPDRVDELIVRVLPKERRKGFKES